MPSYDKNATLFLGLSQIKGVGFKTLRELGGVPEAAYKIASGELDPLLHDSLKSHSRTNLEEKLMDLGEKLISHLRASDVHLICHGDPLYPARFLDLPHETRPLWVFCRGNIDLLSADSVAVVGTRSPTVVGDFLTKFAVSVSAQDGLPVVSGLAKGIDSVAHEWALVLRVPTISVLGTGILRPYPSSNIRLADDIVESGGLLLSEYMPYSEPTGQNFVMRNRLQAALSRCVIAPEWRRSSGTAHTIRFAKALGRPSLNLMVEGVPNHPDHGVADASFVVPRQHQEFLESVRQAVSISVVSKAQQTDLFGGGS
ncbi:MULTISPECIES: DNA-processing protein DprA [Novilysobacter]|uniref:DNA-processing protein DprA n=1 Tax=Novilysobacter TaxID=3382699 RepID=UPI002EDA9A86